MDQKATLACDSLDLIEHATRNGCSSRALQDIVGNLLVLLAWFDDQNGTRVRTGGPIDERVRALLVDSLAKAGVPLHAIPDSLVLIRDCFGDHGLIAELNLDEAFPGSPAAD